MVSCAHSVIPSSVAAELRGKRVLIVGGDCRPNQLQRLRRTLPETEFVWHPTRQSDPSFEGLERLVTRSNVHVVMVVHGLTRTAHSKAVRRLCSSHAKPLIWCWRPTPTAIVRAFCSRRAAA